MILCQAYAAYNHKIIQDVIVKLALKFGLKEYERIMSTHNYIDPVDRLIRKGAIRSPPFETMKNVFSTSVGVGTLDEAPQAYKDTDTIKEIMKDTCNVLYTVKPVINIKAKNTADE